MKNFQIVVTMDYEKNWNLWTFKTHFDQTLKLFKTLFVFVNFPGPKNEFFFKDFQWSVTTLYKTFSKSFCKTSFEF